MTSASSAKQQKITCGTWPWCRLIAAGLTVSSAKRKFARYETTFLGFTVSRMASRPTRRQYRRSRFFLTPGTCAACGHSWAYAHTTDASSRASPPSPDHSMISRATPRADTGARRKKGRLTNSSRRSSRHQCWPSQNPTRGRSSTQMRATTAGRSPDAQ